MAIYAKMPLYRSIKIEIMANAKTFIQHPFRQPLYPLVGMVALRHTVTRAVPFR